ETRSALTAPEFEVGAPDSNDGGTIGPLVKTPVLESGPDGRHRARYDRGTTTGLTPAAQQALERWRAVLLDIPSADLILQPG
ncbi:clavaminate synthase, partial [Streptomyces sp. SID8455]|nr:clavaminate synthase [Streptomyces sp. SID8455]